MIGHKFADTLDMNRIQLKISSLAVYIEITCLVERQTLCLCIPYCVYVVTWTFIKMRENSLVKAVTLFFTFLWQQCSLWNQCCLHDCEVSNSLYGEKLDAVIYFHILRKANSYRLKQTFTFIFFCAASLSEKIVMRSSGSLSTPSKSSPFTSTEVGISAPSIQQIWNNSTRLLKRPHNCQRWSCRVCALILQLGH